MTTRQEAIDGVNRLFDRIGAAVRYWPVYPPIDGIPPVDTTTRSEAWTLGDGSVVVLVVGKTGGVHLSHVEVRHG